MTVTEAEFLVAVLKAVNLVDEETIQILLQQFERLVRRTVSNLVTGFVATFLLGTTTKLDAPATPA